VLNGRGLPQFPEWEPPFPASRDWRHPDGLGVRIWGVLSDRAPLRVPPDRLRPLRVDPALERVRRALLEEPADDETLQVLVLPEDADGSEWSDRVPEVPVLVEHAGGRPAVVPVHGGRQLRVRPGMHGRAVIRVWVSWDTVDQRFGEPKGEVVWVYPPNLERLDVPGEIESRLRGLKTPEVRELREALLARAEVAWMPEGSGAVPDNRIPDGRRAELVSRDHVWMRLNANASEVRAWASMALPGGVWIEREGAGRGDLEVLVPASVAAGAGGDAMPIRRWMDAHPWAVEFAGFSTRDLLCPLPEETR